MAPILASITTWPDGMGISNLYGRVRKAIDGLILHDLKALLKPGQAPAPLIAAAVLGTFLSFIPAPFVDTLLVGFIFARFRQVNRSALLAARFVWNDLVVVPLYVPGFRFGMGLLDPYVANSSALPVRASAFSLGLLALTLMAACISAVVMFAFITLLSYRRGSSP